MWCMRHECVLSLSVPPRVEGCRAGTGRAEVCAHVCLWRGRRVVRSVPPVFPRLCSRCFLITSQPAAHSATRRQRFHLGHRTLNRRRSPLDAANVNRLKVNVMDGGCVFPPKRLDKSMQEGSIQKWCMCPPSPEIINNNYQLNQNDFIQTAKKPSGDISKLK